MSGIVGRLFREFAITLSLAILVSLVVSLTTTRRSVRDCYACPATTRPIAAINPWQRTQALVRFPRPAATGVARRLRTLAHMVSAPSAAVARHPRRHDRPECVPVHRDPEGFFPQEDTDLIGGIPGGSEHLVSGHGAETQADHEDHRRRPGGGQRSRLYRRTAGQYRLRVRRAQALVRASRNGGRSDCASASPTPMRCPVGGSIFSRCRTFVWADGKAMRNTSSPCSAIRARTCMRGPRG